MKKLQIIASIVFVSFFILLGEFSYAQFTGHDALFVIADGTTPNDAENLITWRLEDMEFDVEIIDQDDVTDATTDGKSLVLISATVSSGTVAGNMPGLIDCPIPVINWEPFLYDHLGFQPGDGGEFNTTEIEIIMEDHPLAGGLDEGPVIIATAEKAVSYGTPKGDAVIIAVNTAVDTQSVLFGYDTGATMDSTFVAPARRVGSFLLNDVADLMTEDGWALFDSSVTWAMGGETNIEDSELSIPEDFVLHNNYPNPFNPVTHIVFSIPTQTNVRLTVYNGLGEEVVTLVEGIRTTGNHTVTFDASELASGLYLYKLKAGPHILMKKMLILK